MKTLLYIIGLSFSFVSHAISETTIDRTDPRWNFPMEAVLIVDTEGGSGFSLGCKSYDDTVNHNIELYRHILRRDMFGIKIPDEAVWEVVSNGCIILSGISMGGMVTDAEGHKAVFVTEAHRTGKEPEDNIGWFYFFPTQLVDQDQKRVDQRN